MTEEDASLQSNAIDIGATLRKAREEASYSIAFVADQIHLPEAVVEALEHNEFERLPGPVFVRGYIRSYAKLLDIDAQPLVGQIDGGLIPEVADSQMGKPIKIKTSRLDPLVVWGAVTVCVIAVGLLFAWWMQESKEDPVQLAEVVEQVEVSGGHTAEPNPMEVPDKQEHQVSLGDVSLNSQSAQSPESGHTSRNNSDQNSELIVSATDKQEIVEIPAVGGDTEQTRLTVIFNEESWAEIFDARKRRLLHGLIKPGATRVISGQAPFSVFLGNSPGVVFEINGEKYDHSPYIRGNKTARFQIDDQNT
ncbi:MAG: RodZ domain-containing protein [Pseudomonadota bacterium]